MVLLRPLNGRPISAHYASRYPQHVDHLVLVGPAAVPARPRRIQPGESKMYDLARAVEGRVHAVGLPEIFGALGQAVG